MPAFNDELVYVVDDDEAVRDSIKILLEACRLRVRDYESCGAFLDDVGRPEAGCLLLDLHMPVVSGIEFLERHGRDLDGLPIIMITGRGDPATLARARELGVSAVLEKPFEDEALLDALRRYMRPQDGAPGRLAADRPRASA